MATAVNQDATGDSYIDGLLGGTKWNGSFTFSFPNATTDYPAGYPEADTDSNFAPVTFQQREATRAIMTGTTTAGTANVMLATNVNSFIQVLVSEADGPGLGRNGHGDIRLGEASDPKTAYAALPNNDADGRGGDVWFGTKYVGTSADYRNPVMGNYAYYTHIHELGHAMGLKHPHEAEGPGNLTLPSDKDSVEWTVMSYRSYVGGPIGNDVVGLTFGQWSAPQTFMMYDIQALQTMYGAFYGTNAGNTTYSWSATTGETFINGVSQGTPGGNQVFMTVWDGGGIDTYDMFNFSRGVTINLAPGASSITSEAQRAYLGNSHYAEGTVYNSLLFNGDLRSIIENATGGAGDDTITGNQVDNVLIGFGGHDEIAGGEGNDTLYGGTEADTLKGGGGVDGLFGGEQDDTLKGGGGADALDGGNGTDTVDYSFSLAVDVNLATGQCFGGDAGADTLFSIENIRGSAQGDTLTGDGNANSLLGEDGNDKLKGAGGFDNLEGGLGDDNLKGGGGADVLNGGAGLDAADYSDTVNAVTVNLATGIGTGNDAQGDTYTDIENLTGSGGADNLTGDAGANVIYGAGGNDVIRGGGGVDSLHGGDGNDQIYVDQTLDVVSEGVGGGNDRVFASVSYVLAAGQEIEILSTTNTAGAGAINLTGNEFGNTVIGNNGINALNGGGAADKLYGYGGNDLYYADNAADLVFEAAGGGTGDRVLASVSYVLAAGQEIEILSTTNTAGLGALNLTGNAFNNTIVGNFGANVLNGGGGIDQLYGYGSNDQYFVDNALDRAVEALGGGTDRVLSSVSYVLGAGQEIEIFTTTNTAGLGAINLTGNAFSQTMHGNGGANVLNGGAGNDVISGFGGADIFVFNTALNALTNHDTITDFNVAADTIHLENAVFTALAATGALAAGLFRDLSLGAQDANDVIIYNRVTGDLFYESNGLAAGGQTLFADVTNGLALTSLDFFVV
jgi:serralysin